MNSKKLFIYHLFMLFIPATKLFKFKASLLRWCGAKVGSNVRIVSSAKFYLNGELSIGDNTWIGHEVMIVGGQAPVIIGKDCYIAPRVMLATGSHKINDLTSCKIAGEGYSLAIEVGDGCWLCSNATLLAGVVLGNKCLIGANTLVNKSFPDNSIVLGNPGVLRKKETK